MDYVICSLDKDLKQIPGHHYNWRRDEFDFVEPIEGLRHFYRQLLTGDRTDNIFGIRGIGTVKSGRLIDNLNTEEDMFHVVQAMYADDQRLLMNGQCLYIMREEGRRWSFPPASFPLQEND